MRALRHSSGSTLMRVGVPLHEVKEFMGHARITTTEQYLHVYDDEGGWPTCSDLVTFKRQEFSGHF